jgi:hypothetical protein
MAWSTKRPVIFCDSRLQHLQGPKVAAWSVGFVLDIVSVHDPTDYRRFPCYMKFATVCDGPVLSTCCFLCDALAPGGYLLAMG